VAEYPEASPRGGLDGIECVRMRVLERNVGNVRMQSDDVPCWSFPHNHGESDSNSNSNSMGVREGGRYGERGVRERSSDVEDADPGRHYSPVDLVGLGENGENDVLLVCHTRKHLEGKWHVRI